MTRRHKIFQRILPVVLLAMLPTLVLADLTPLEIRNQFNAMNVNRGYVFEMYNDQYYAIPPSSGEMRLLNLYPNQMPDTSAYNVDMGTAGAFGERGYFQTFCVTPEIIMDVGTETAGKLNYDGTYTKTTATAANGYVGETLTFGAAYLYKQFASGELDYAYLGANSQRTNDAIALQDMIWYLQGKPILGSDSIMDNKYYAYLNDTLSGTGFDMFAAYDLNANYGNLMDDYKVFVMNTSVATSARMPGTQPRQDVLYVVRDGSDVVPEPASILLWTLGGLGAAGAAYRKRRLNAK
jgi:hypothetical protein